jgi:signal transduction histidine kinase
MITLPVFPLWFVGFLASALVILFNWLSFKASRRLMAQDPENALWLFLYWLTLAFLIFACTHAVSHALQDGITFFDLTYLGRLRRIIGGFDSVIYVVITAITLFFHNMQRLYRRMEENHHHLEATSQEILALNREMEALVMERTMSEMALGMAHGIRNPLHVIGGFSHRLLKKTDEADPSRAWVSAIAEEARRIEQMVERFETLAQRKTSFFAQEDLNVIVETTLDLIRPECRAKEIHLVAHLHPDPLVGRLNKHLLKVALSHLLRNAIEATAPEGTIRVSSTVEHNYVILVIQDSGRGMPPDVVDKVFVPFYTTKIGGTGLGMVFVRQIVDEHRGFISLESKLGQGTTVTIRLPHRFAARPEMSAEAPATSTP